jgi:hypothetical protein
LHPHERSPASRPPAIRPGSAPSRRCRRTVARSTIERCVADGARSWYKAHSRCAMVRIGYGRRKNPRARSRSRG